MTIAVWLLCMAVPLAYGLHVRDAHADTVSGEPVWPLGAPLLRDRLLIGMWTAQTARLTAVDGTAEVAAWSPSGQYLAVGYSSGSVLLWDVRHQRLAARLGRAHRRFVSALTWSPDGHLLVSAAGDGSAMIWKVAKGSLTALQQIHVNARLPYVLAAAISSHGRWLAVADGQHSVYVWDLARLSSQGSARGQRGALGSSHPHLVLHVSGHTMALAWSPDGSHLAVGTADGRVVTWTARASWPRITHVVGSPVYAVAWAPNGSVLAVGGADGAARLLDAGTLQLRALLLAPFDKTPVLHVPDYGLPQAANGKAAPQLAAGAAINSLAWSPSGDLLTVTATGVPMRFWQLSGGAMPATYQDNWDMNAVTWSADGSQVAVARDDGSVVLLDVKVPRSTQSQWLCQLLGQHWCPPLLGRQPSIPAENAAPPSYMSR